MTRGPATNGRIGAASSSGRPARSRRPPERVPTSRTPVGGDLLDAADVRVDDLREVVAMEVGPVDPGRRGRLRVITEHEMLPIPRQAGFDHVRFGDLDLPDLVA